MTTNIYKESTLPALGLLIVLALLLNSNKVMARDIDPWTLPKPVAAPLVFGNTGSALAEKEDDEAPRRWFSKRKWHQYFGLGSLALATMTAVVPKPEEDASDSELESSLHYKLANSAAFLGGAAVATGLAFHYEDLSWKHLTKNPDNWHALLGTLGTLGYIAAIANAPGESHPTFGVAGAVSMLAAIKITW